MTTCAGATSSSFPAISALYASASNASRRMSSRTVNATTARSDTPGTARHTRAPGPDVVIAGHGAHAALPTSALKKPAGHGWQRTLWPP